jgi:hypothetical protein
VAKLAGVYLRRARHICASVPPCSAELSQTHCISLRGCSRCEYQSEAACRHARRIPNGRASIQDMSKRPGHKYLRHTYSQHLHDSINQTQEIKTAKTAIKTARSSKVCRISAGSVGDLRAVSRERTRSSWYLRGMGAELCSPNLLIDYYIKAMISSI